MNPRLLLVVGGVALLSAAATLHMLYRNAATAAPSAAAAMSPTMNPAPPANTTVATSAGTAAVESAPPPVPHTISAKTRRQALAALLDAADKQEKRLQAQLSEAKQRGVSVAEMAALEAQLARVQQGRHYAIVKNAQLGE